jgi:hypothetical protein
VRNLFQTLPRYYKYYARPVKFVATPDGGMAVWKLSLDTGGWEPGDEALVDEIVGAVGGEVTRLDRDRFIDLTEATRGELIRGEGPVFALYETVNGIIADARKEHHNLTPEAKALVQGIRKRTYAMFEAELARRGDPAADV